MDDSRCGSDRPLTARASLIGAVTETARPPAPVASIPRYDGQWLGAVVPSLLSALGAGRFSNVLDLPPTSRACLLLVDGLGWEVLRRHADLAPFLASLLPAGRVLTAPFPSSTAVSVASLGTGRPPGSHGMIGYTMHVPALGGPMNAISWTPYGVEEDLRARIRPEEVQPLRTLAEQAEPDGIAMTFVVPAHFEASGLTRAALRGGRYIPVESIRDDAAIAAVADVLAARARSAVYTYYPELDAAGHRHGVHSEEWRGQLGAVDELVARVAEVLPSGTTLLVTGDHGMVDLPEDDTERVEVADEPDLMDGVRFLAGEARIRYVHVRDGADDAVLRAWRDRLGHAMWIVSREEAIESGWFGPRVDDHVRPRIGDVVAAAFGPIGVFDRAVDPLMARIVGHHGSMTADEQLVPLLSYTRE